MLRDVVGRSHAECGMSLAESHQLTVIVKLVAIFRFICPVDGIYGVGHVVGVVITLLATENLLAKRT